MLNPAQKFTQSESLLLEQRLSRLYRQAYRETTAEANQFWEKFGTSIHDKFAQLEEGKISKTDYYSWVNGNAKIGKRLDKLSANIADRMANTGAIAETYINNTTPKIFRENANYEAYTMEKELNFEPDFTLINDDTLKAVMESNTTEFDAKWKHDPDSLPWNQVNIDSKKIYNWSYSKVQDSMYIGILKGESINKIASRLLQVTESNKATAVRNARTACNSAQQQGRMYMFARANEMGIQVVKEWIATEDMRTRDSHMNLNGVRVPWEEEFPNGLMFPCDKSGRPEEVYNCRCDMRRVPFDKAQREVWAWDEENETYVRRVNDVESYKKWLERKNKSDTYTKQTESSIIKSPKKSEDEHFNKILERLNASNVDYNPVIDHASAISDSEIVDRLCGGDLTQGSCASVGLAYIGQRQGWDVLDFRDGMSRRTFSSSLNLHELSKMNGITATYYGDVAGKSSITLANNFLKTCEEGKEYYLCVGRHAAIVRRHEGTLQYLELQSAKRSGWTNFNGNPRYTLSNRFGCSSSSGHGERYDFMMNITDSNFNTEDFRSLLGYINTNATEQKKGFSGTIK